MSKWKKLTTKKDHKAALTRINELIDAEKTDAVQNELTLLSFLVEDYENEIHPMPHASPLDVIRFAMEMKNMKQQDLIPVLGTKGNVSKILNGKASLQVEDLHPLSILLGIPVESIIAKTGEGLVSKKVNPTQERASAVMEPLGRSYRSKSQNKQRQKRVATKRNG